MDAQKGLADRYGRLQLEEKDGDEVDMLLPDFNENEDWEGGMSEWSLVGMVLSDKAIKFLLFRDTMASIWSPSRGISSKDISDKMYLFSFYHEIDMRRVLEYGLWLYDQNLIVIHELTPNDLPLQVTLYFSEF
ncbi:unnamed protein product [Cuscuta europaea]|uniref:DUF4283 domain-containing protein n=1 Tax=Cuscuta europaea TaxID=41803 RepID=A0A9P1EDV4_CUSEU|nr:unnamed protein product [Cuscuta europaea]